MSIKVYQVGAVIKINYSNFTGQVDGSQIARHVRGNFNWASTAPWNEEGNSVGVLTINRIGLPERELALLKSSVDEFVRKHSEDSDRSDLDYLDKRLDTDD